VDTSEVTVRFTCTDALSGIATCPDPVVLATNGADQAVTRTATDMAGNTTTVTGTSNVKYRFDGFLQPINDTAHQVGVSTSIFKAGSTVPVNFQLKRNDGTVVQAASAPVWLTPVKGSATSAPVDESVYSASADSGSTYQYDATASSTSTTGRAPAPGATTGGSASGSTTDRPTTSTSGCADPPRATLAAPTGAANAADVTRS
jgi:hypothetical protein